MVPGNLHIVGRSIRFYIKPVFYQILIIGLLSAVITGSLLTGRSVKSSLRKSAFEHLGNTGILVSSGLRFIDTSIVRRVNDSVGLNCSGILELKCYCQNLSSQKGTPNAHVYGVGNDFFRFHGNDSLQVRKGELAINKKLADYLEIKTGDELILRFSEISDIPADAPFAPAKGEGVSVVMKVGTILKASEAGNFSLSISQITPMNIFLNLSDIPESGSGKAKINRLLVDYKNNTSTEEIRRNLQQVLKPSDIGLKIRTVRKTGEMELISDRVFIDESVAKEIEKALPSSASLITYLANNIKYGSKSNPYSFVTGLPSSLYPDIGKNNEIIVNRWLAEDLSASEGDTVEMSWYAPDSRNKPDERRDKFVIKRIVEMQGIWADSLLMPEFPGISGSKSCSDWDAGVLINTREIRQKDEDYWRKFRGTPKAFINYEKAREIWGNNFGPATSIRINNSVSVKEISGKIAGNLDPEKSGLIISDLRKSSLKAATESVDFSTLLLSLGFFLIVSALVLLSLAVSTYFNSKKDQLKVFFALGFENRWIVQQLLFESGLIALAGSLTGAFGGYFVNVLITRALNSVWMGAVQTDTLKAFFDFASILAGFAATFLTVMIFMFIKIRRYLGMMNRKEKEINVKYSSSKNLIFFSVTLSVAVLLFILSFVIRDKEAAFCFAAGTMLMIAMIVFCRIYFIGIKSLNPRKARDLSHLYYSFYPSQAITPVLFIAAGIFAVFITSANRMDFNKEHLKRSGGTGGYLLWCETTLPVKEDLNSVSGRKLSGIDSNELIDMSFIQAKRTSGDDASCLNLNHVTAPPLLGLDPSDFIVKKSFSFSKIVSGEKVENGWQFLNVPSENNTIYGIADQTVLEWGLKIKTGDTLTLRAENGEPLNIIIAAALKSSVFQGYVLIGMNNFIKYYPSVSGSSIMLVDGNPAMTDLYKSTLNDRFENNGISTELTSDRLAAFYEVTNTYLSVFGIFGALGMITGITGLGFVLLRNYNYRKREFALMAAAGFSIKAIRRLILSEQVLILFAGIATGVLSAVVATLPSIKSSPDIPWLLLIIMVLSLVLAGLTALLFSIRAVTHNSLTASLKKE